VSSPRGVLARRCFKSLSSKEWNAGVRYCNLGCVTLSHVDSDELTVFVRGTAAKPYEVVLDWSLASADLVVVASCSCPRYDEGHLCKHIAAAVLFADEKQFGARVPGRGSLDLVSDDDFWEDDEEDEEDVRLVGPPVIRGMAAAQPISISVPAVGWPRTPPPPPPRPQWRQQLLGVEQALNSSRWKSPDSPARSTARAREIWYRVNIEASRNRGLLIIEICQRETRLNGEPGAMKLLRIDGGEAASLPDPTDRELLTLLLGSKTEDDYTPIYYGHDSSAKPCRVCLTAAMAVVALPRLCATGRCGWTSGNRYAQVTDATRVFRWDDGPPWQFKLRILPAKTQQGWILSGVLFRGDTLADARSARLLIDGLILFDDTAARLDPNVPRNWISALEKPGEIAVPTEQQDQFIEQLWKMPGLPPLDLPTELRWEQIDVEPRPRIVIKAPQYGGPTSALEGKVTFRYDDHEADADDNHTVFVDAKQRRIVRRDLAREQLALAQVFELGLKRPASYDAHRCDARLARKQLPKVVAALTTAGWEVEAEGKLLRRAGDFRLSVSSGVDWFELDAQVDFGGETVGLPELLAAARRGEQYVRLGDGTHGMLPEEWLKRYAPLAEMGTAEEGKLRFAYSQALLLDAWLEAQPNVDVDAAFERVRDRLRSFEGVKPGVAPAGFVGTLRDYQREGLGWLDFLAEFGFGGCLADDMGLGKTIQVLAFLESRRAAPAEEGRPKLPSLVVVPRSLVHNWIEEAARFAPQLRVLDYTGLERIARREEFDRYDLIVTTYGTLRRDAGVLKDMPFDYAILDESQAVKNSASQAAKACRLLSARHRLAMTGTPIENHLGELWSLFEFLNPGMLGRSATLKRFAGGRGRESGDLQRLAKALRPFMLRRTKEQVLSELPEKTEQTLYCELDGKQRKLYDELRQHYRDLLTKKIASDGLQKSKIQVLEALLRLRQAACHPALIDKSNRKLPSAKLETLMEQLREVLREGHKALVFSQFTSLLSLVREEFDRHGIIYEYLDGSTRDRKQRVERFQTDADCQVFLISLKAGGVGLNLTAADYVFILDPWWNPAVEAQAVDRAHRIGQERRVFAYRLIARDTVEEKILQLQGDKRKLAEAIISADNSLISSLTADDLKLLLS